MYHCLSVFKDWAKSKRQIQSQLMKISFYLKFLGTFPSTKNDLVSLRHIVVNHLLQFNLIFALSTNLLEILARKGM